MAAKQEERLAGFAIALFSTAYFVSAFFIEEAPIPQQVGPDVFPKGVGILMIVLSLIHLFQVFRGKGKEDKKRSEIIGADEKVEKKADLKAMGLVIVIMILYALLFEVLGYAIATFLAFMAGVLVLDRKHLWRDLIIAVVAGFGLQIIFGVFLRVNLPTGLLSLIGF